MIQTIDKLQLSKYILENRTAIGSLKEEFTVSEKLTVKNAVINYGFEITDTDPFFKINNKPETLPKQDGALVVTGEFTVEKQGMMDTDHGPHAVNLMVFQFTVCQRRMKMLADYLLEKNLVALYPGLDGEYLSGALSEQAENDFMQETKKLAPGRQMFVVAFSGNGTFDIKSEESIPVI